MVGVSVTLGRLPGAITLNGLRVESNTKLCIRWLMPMPEFPAMHAGTQPPLGVMETTQPSLSAASTVVVPNQSLSWYSVMEELFLTSCVGAKFLLEVSISNPRFFSNCTNGFVLPSKG